VACHFNVKALRDINPEQLQERAGFLDLTLYRRAQHVISENQRVLDAEKALKRGDAAALGLLMNQSHTSLRDDYAVSREELDQMVAIAQGQPGCYGARMTGAGFGGCAVALVAEDQTKNFQVEVVKQYRAKTGLDPKVYISSAAGGTDIELLD
jgi:galactokinase